ncbi:MAG: KEOPS complex subunit Pcc1 [Candidatus Bathyarchaeota archaeon]|jgi:KEOPS complex subunit Pcc1|nr:KEOPS complex subunit Pcc1 [Candidatus Bathyarchaeota archaeon]MDD4324809.1 KEOPS complex subunit Pcc1 [Candidatus Bathyarchaeota archaeon]MDI9576741.1 KEOPS complex subunit Pcc1 [Thermoproteota archaeon]MDT8781436.1 hypothetical protein [Candidatus Bathyarchaeota archaeon]NLD65408.1 hypothetical protein [Thermoproteota archaeon]
MSINSKATIKIKFSSEKQIRSLFNAITPETEKPPTKRARVKLENDGLFVVLLVESDDTIALRATLNSYLRWINSIVNVLEVIDTF